MAETLTTTPESSAQATLAANEVTLLSLIKGRAHDRDADGLGRLTLCLERVLADEEAKKPVPFDGPEGVEAVLELVCQGLDSCERKEYDGRLMGYSCFMSVAGEAVGLEVGLGAGAQLRCAAGPAFELGTLLIVIEDFDRRVHVAARSLGRSYVLLAEGYNPYASTPLDVSLVPRARWTLLNAALGQTGRYARDAMRCSCGTYLTFEHGSGRDALLAYRLACALSPVLCFLTDNVRSFRGVGARRSPRMVRSVVRDEVDPARCGLAPKSLSAEFGFEDYLAWLMGIQPVLVAANGSVESTGKKTLGELATDRLLDREEAQCVLDNVFPWVRMAPKGFELSCADALRPRMAAGYAALAKGLFASPLSRDTLLGLIGGAGEADVRTIELALRRDGWSAVVFGLPMPQLAARLVEVAQTGLTDPSERALIRGLAELWEVRMVPRDAFVRQETKAVRGW